MRLHTKISCAIITGVSVTSLAAFAGGCVGDDNAAPAGSDSGVDSTVEQPETSTPDNDTGVDSTVPSEDAGEDANDSATPDTGVDAGCVPTLAGGWTPPAYVPASGTFEAQCNNGGQIDGYWNACLGDASTPTACAGFADAGPGNVQCGACLVSQADASTYGPEVQKVIPELNVAGCIQNADDSDAGYSCAVAVQAAQACAEASCASASCAVTSDPATVAAYVACLSSAATSTCASFAGTAKGCLAVEQDAGAQAASRCLGGATIEDAFDNIGAFFCES